MTKKLPSELQKEVSQVIKKCYSCSRCISGCPVVSEMGFGPALIVKWLAVGDYDKLLKSKAIWLCSSCQTCLSRCPFDIDIPHIIDLLKEYANREKLAHRERPTRLFHKIFLLNIKYFGRVHETGFIGVWKGLSGKWFNDLGLGFKMLCRGKLPIFPEKIKGTKEIQKLFKK